MPSPHRSRLWIIVAVLVAATACGQQDSPQDTGQATAAEIAQPTGAAAPTTAAPAPPGGYEATLLLVQEDAGSNSVDVHLPQLTGGPSAVRERFNGGMRTALDDLVGPASETTVKDGSLMGDERSRVTTITEHVVAGVAVFNWYGAGAAHPNNSVATIVIDADTADPILLQDVFVDQQAAAERLSAIARQLDDRVGPLTP
ncbi:hypothetical protein, partial [Micromonospora sp. WMMD736]|uniref:hypothetical protein n=1 Tax=Micromonospora sp. WMMD736 TaxID=3404112 RepID=UPI003B930086